MDWHHQDPGSFWRQKRRLGFSSLTRRRHVEQWLADSRAWDAGGRGAARAKPANGAPMLSERELGDIWIGAKHDPAGWVAAGQCSRAEMDQVLAWACAKGFMEPRLRLVEECNG